MQRGVSCVDAQYSIRLLEVELKGFKNVDSGKIEMPGLIDKSYKEPCADIIGIYGQNGSGKTSAIEALTFLKDMMSGQSLQDDAVYYIGSAQSEAVLSFRFFMSCRGFELLLKYEFTIGRDDKDGAIITSEKISFSELGETNNIRPEKTLIKFDRASDESFFLPKYRYKQLSGGKKELEIRIRVAKIVSGKDKKSFIFCDEFRELWEKGIDSEPIWAVVLPCLRHYAFFGLFTFTSKSSSATKIDFEMPFMFKHETLDKIIVANIPITLLQPNILEKGRFAVFREKLREFNSVVSALVPNLSIVVREQGERLTQDGKDGIQFELASRRGEAEIPLLYESEGIKKIISVLGLLITLYNNPSTCVAIDELDAGIYEYLLGELLCVIQETGKGQLIFTSHNLRPLEMLHKSSLLFTTTNPKNRYIRLTNVKSSNNLRDLYLRSINLDGQREQIYSPTEEYKIRTAFRKAAGRTDE